MVSDDEAGLGGGKGERYVFDGRDGWRWSGLAVVTVVTMVVVVM